MLVNEDFDDDLDFVGEIDRPPFLVKLYKEPEDADFILI